MKTIFLVSLYLSAIVAANLTVAAFGPSVVIINAFLFIGLDITTRDSLHESWQGNHLWPKLALLIGAGALLSYLLNRTAGRIALASLVAFAVSALADTITFHLLRRRPWWVKVNGSNLVSAAIDSAIFPTLAFGLWLPLVVAGQFIAKVAGGAAWSFILKFFRGGR